MARTGEVVVVLGHIGHDAQTVRDTHGDHVIGVQESRDPQFLFSHFKGLGWRQVQRWKQEQPQGREDREMAVLVNTSQTILAHYGGDRVTKVPSPCGGLKE